MKVIKRSICGGSEDNSELNRGSVGLGTLQARFDDELFGCVGSRKQPTCEIKEQGT